MSGSESDSSVDSDTELQRAFAEGRLQPGLNRLTPATPAKPHINNVAGLRQKLKEFQQDLPLGETMAVDIEPVALLTEDDVDDDFKMEMRFYRQAQAAVLHVIPKLQKRGIVTKRPADFFAEMAKSDVHMQKIRTKLLEKKTSMERSEAAKKLREAKKYGKKVQQEVALKRQQEKKDLADAVKKYRKGKANNLDEILENSNKKMQSKNVNKKRQKKNQKFGFGGQKKRGKRNTKESLDMPWKKSGKSSASNTSQGKFRQKAKRPGKDRRNQNKNRRK